MYKRAAIPENGVIEVKATSIISNINPTFDSSNFTLQADRDRGSISIKAEEKTKKCSSTDYSA